MKIGWLVILAAMVVGTWACDGGGGDGGGGVDVAVEELPAGEVEEDQGSGPVALWEQVLGAGLGEVTQVKGFSAASGALYLTVTSPASAGLFWLDRVGGAQEFAKIFEGTGVTLATDAGTYMALWENKAGSLVQVSQEGEATDLSYNFEQREIQRMVFTDGLLYLLSKNWEVAEYQVNRGSAASQQWDQLGVSTNETAMGFHSDGDEVVVVTVRNDLPLGINCKQIPANAGEGDTWTDCPGFPQHLGDGPNDPYSVKVGITGDGSNLAAWFEILKAGQRTYEVQVGTMAGGWTVVSGLPEGREPAGVLLDEDTLYVAYTGAGEGKQVFTVPAIGGEAVAAGEGLPEPEHDKSGVVAMAKDGGAVYALFQDYNAGGSTVTAFEFTGH